MDLPDLTQAPLRRRRAFAAACLERTLGVISLDYRFRCSIQKAMEYLWRLSITKPILSANVDEIEAGLLEFQLKEARDGYLYYLQRAALSGLFDQTKGTAAFWPVDQWIRDALTDYEDRLFPRPSYDMGETPQPGREFECDRHTELCTAILEAEDVESLRVDLRKLIEEPNSRFPPVEPFTDWGASLTSATEELIDAVEEEAGPDPNAGNQSLSDRTLHLLAIAGCRKDRYGIFHGKCGQYAKDNLEAAMGELGVFDCDAAHHFSLSFGCLTISDENGGWRLETEPFLNKFHWPDLAGFERLRLATGQDLCPIAVGDGIWLFLLSTDGRVYAVPIPGWEPPERFVVNKNDELREVDSESKILLLVADSATEFLNLLCARDSKVLPVRRVYSLEP